MEVSPNLLIPSDDIDNPKISVVIPAMNESVNIEEFITWVKIGLSELPIKGEILIVDSSEDNTASLAVKCGARVLQVPRRGLGRAYIDAIPYVRGNFVVMGDADCTYDFRDLKPFYTAYIEGAEFVMGSRYRGSIEKGAMPPHHQYFGTPITTWILNRIFKSKFSDIHCGMRGLTTEFLRNMNMQSQSWEYASEMVIKAVQMGARISEVPVKFYKDRNGRQSHHKREGWFSPFKAAWINLRAMFVHGVDSFLVLPGQILMAVGSVLLLMQTFGSVSIGSLTFSTYWQLLGAFLFMLGVNAFLLGVNVRKLFDYTNRYTNFSNNLFTYNKAMLMSGVTALLGLGALSPLIYRYVTQGLRLLTAPQWHERLAIIGLTLISLSGVIFAHVLVFHAIHLSSFGSKREDKRE